MFDKINDQVKDALKPITELATLNVTTLQTIAEKQNALFSSLLSSGVSYAETASQQKDVMSLAEAHKAYVDSFQESVKASATEAYNLVTGAQQKASEILKDVSEEMTSKFSAVAK